LTRRSMQLLSYEAYGLWIARLLAESAKPVTRTKMEERLGIDEGFIQQVLIRLSAAGLVRSERGKEGGYCLAKDAAKITLRMVIEAASERPVFATDPEDAPLLSSARRLIRDRVVPCLDEPLLSWKLPPKFKPLDVS